MLKNRFLILFILLEFSEIIRCITTNASYFYNEERPLIIAHRGASAYLPENTIESAITAVFMDADFILVDVVLTKD